MQTRCSMSNNVVTHSVTPARYKKLEIDETHNNKTKINKSNEIDLNLLTKKTRLEQFIVELWYKALPVIGCSSPHQHNGFLPDLLRLDRLLVFATCRADAGKKREAVGAEWERKAKKTKAYTVRLLAQ